MSNNHRDGKVRYREAEYVDAQAMLDLWREFWPEQPYERHLPDKISREPDLVLVADCDGEIVGTVIGGFDGWWAWVYRVVVREDMQGRGIATHLMKQIHKRLKERGADSVSVVAEGGNTRLAQFLGRLEYKPRSFAIHSLQL